MATDDKPDEAVPTASQVLAAELSNARKRQGLTAEDLAARVKLHGGKLDRAAISKIENELRDVSLDDAILLAVALGVAPIHLFLPREDDALISVAPAWNVTAPLARRWVRGAQPLQFQDDRVYRTEVPASEWKATNDRLAMAELEAEQAYRELRVAKGIAETITAELAKLDRRTSGLALPFNPEAIQTQRLERQLLVAYERIAEATVTAEDAAERVRTLQREAPGGDG